MWERGKGLQSLFFSSHTFSEPIESVGNCLVIPTATQIHLLENFPFPPPMTRPAVSVLVVQMDPLCKVQSTMCNHKAAEDKITVGK